MSFSCTSKGWLFIDGKPINRVRKFTCLSVVFDNRLTWNSQVEQMIIKVGKHMGMLGRLHFNLTIQSVNIVFISLIR